MSEQVQLLSTAVAMLGLMLAAYRDLHGKLARCESRHVDCDKRVAAVEKRVRQQRRAPSPRSPRK